MNRESIRRHNAPVVGLALSGGAVRGAAHIGVLQVLERAGIRADIVAGTSVGAVVGAGYAAEVPVTDMSHLIRNMRWPTLLSISLSNRYGLFDTSPLENFIQTHLDVRLIEELPRRFAAVACDILTGERIVLDRGSVALAVRASAALPGFFSPVEHDGQLLIDGGVVDNLPAGIVREMGADYVIAVDLITSATTGAPRPSNPLEMLIAATNLMICANHPDPRTVDCYIQPALSDLPGWDFKDVPEIEMRGRVAAEQVVAKIKEDIAYLAENAETDEASRNNGTDLPIT